MNYQDIAKKVIELVTKTGSELLELRNSLNQNDIEVKGKNNFVTRFDKMSEEKLVEGLGNILPEAGFIAEEGTSDKKGEVYNWIIDPIDGTTNFMHGAPPFSISVALQENQQTVIGVVYDIFSGECFNSWLGAPVYINTKQVTCSSAEKVADALVATGFPYTDFGRMQKFMGTLTYFMENSHGIRRLGSAAVDLAYVACGRYDAFYEYGLHAWDVAAGAFLVQQAGGKVSDYSGADNYLFGSEIVASNGKMFNEFQTVIAQMMGED